MASLSFIRFPGFKDKAVTLSYDDGTIQDKKLIEIMSRYGIKGTFNLCSGLFRTKEKDNKNMLTAEEAVSLYNTYDMEVAVHGYNHCSLAKIASDLAVNDVVKDRSNLEKLFGRVIKGMAYANGSYNDSVVEMLKACGINYARTTISTEKFFIPTDWLRLPATAHHNNPRLMELADNFLNKPPVGYFWSDDARLFYLWGHSIEFESNNNWCVIEDFCKFIGGRQDVWYATNGEIYEYVTAFNRLEFSIDGTYVYNPSSIDVFIRYLNEKNYVIPAGKTIQL